MMATRDWTVADLRRWRTIQRLNQTEAAKLFDVAQTTYSLWERGHLPRRFPDRFEAMLLTWYNAKTEAEKC